MKIDDDDRLMLAAVAMNGIIAAGTNMLYRSESELKLFTENTAKIAVMQADALIKELEKKKDE